MDIEGGKWGGKDIRHEHLAPSTLFSVVAFEHVQERAGCLPQEQVAFVAQTQVLSEERLQQVEGTAIVVGGCLDGVEVKFGGEKDWWWVDWRRSGWITLVKWMEGFGLDIV